MTRFLIFRRRPGSERFLGGLVAGAQLKPPYNVQHRHSGIALLTPEDVHLGRVVERRKARQSVLLKAWQAHPERFVRGTPRPPELEPITYINRSEEGEAA